MRIWRKENGLMMEETVKKPRYKNRRYAVQAKRKNTKGNWSEWASFDNYPQAEMQRERAEQLGYRARIIDKGE